MLVIIRPVAVFASTRTSDLKRGEKLFISAMGPRGVVPAFRDPKVSTNVEAIEIKAEKEGIETEHLSIEDDVVRSVNKLVRDKKMDLIVIPLKGGEDPVTERDCLFQEQVHLLRDRD